MNVHIVENFLSIFKGYTMMNYRVNCREKIGLMLIFVGFVILFIWWGMLKSALPLMESSSKVSIDNYFIFLPSIFITIILALTDRIVSNLIAKEKESNDNFANGWYYWFVRAVVLNIILIFYATYNNQPVKYILLCIAVIIILYFIMWLLSLFIRCTNKG